jgi:hypothetical protein
MWELCSAVINSDGVIAGLSVTVNRVACVRLRCYRDHAMFLRSSPRSFIAFSKTRHLTRCSHRLTLPPIGHRVSLVRSSLVRSFTSPAPQVAQRFGVALSFELHIRDDRCKTLLSCFRQTAFSNNLNMMHLPTLPWRCCLTGYKIC